MLSRALEAWEKIATFIFNWVEQNKLKVVIFVDFRLCLQRRHFCWAASCCYSATPLSQQLWTSILSRVVSMNRIIIVNHEWHKLIYCLRWRLFDKALCNKQDSILVRASFVNLTGEESDEQQQFLQVPIFCSCSRFLWIPVAHGLVLVYSY